MKLYKQAEINEFDPRMARKEYQHLRKVAKQRIDRLERNEQLLYIEDIPDLPFSSKLNNTELYKALAEVNRFLKNPFTLVRKINVFESSMIEKFQAAGYTFINKKNIRLVNKLMQEIKKSVGDKSFDSDEALEYVEQFERLNLSNEDFKRMIENYLKYDPEQIKEYIDQAKRLNISDLDFNKRIDEYMSLDIEKLSEIEPIRTGREMKLADVKRKIKAYDSRS